jgi:hypothetical protein
MDGCIHLSRRDVAYTFSDKHRPDLYMGGLLLLTRIFSPINHSNVRFYSIINAVQQLLAQAHICPLHGHVCLDYDTHSYIDNIDEELMDD